MEPVDAGPAADPPGKPRGVRVALVAGVVVAVWATMWAIGRTGTVAPQATPRATPSAAAAPPPALAVGKPQKPPSFSPADGWNVRTSGLVGFGSADLPMAVSSNVPFARQDETFMANYGLSESAAAGTISSLSPRGIVILAVLPFPSGGGPAPPHFGDFPDRRLPLLLSDGRINRQWGSQPRPNAPEYDVWGRVDGTYVEVAVYFGTAKPSAATYAAAQAELARLVLPPPAAGASAAPANWTTGTVGTLTMQTPPGWTFSANPAPLVELAEGNWPFPGGGSCGPEAALRSMPRDGALLWLSETIAGPDERGYPRRPARFTLRGHREAPRECSGGAYLIQFRDHGRTFQAQLDFGPDASARTRALSLRSLSSLRVADGSG